MRGKKKSTVPDYELFFRPYPNRKVLYFVDGQPFIRESHALQNSEATGKEMLIVENPKFKK